MNLLKNTHWFIYAIFILACARQTTPTGGPKDSIPPDLISSLPTHELTHFKGKTVTLTFSETVILNNAKEQIIITPSLAKDVEVKAKKNQVTLTFQEDLRDNTTYTINFREAVQDITEKNPATMLKLAFSTGDYIDSLGVEGSVHEMLTAKEAKDATVSLYETDTFDIFKHRPSYITKADEKGRFKLENLKPGRYFIYAFIDKNKNLIVDSKTESYSFLAASFNLTQNKTGIQLPLVRLDSRLLKLTSARPFGTYFNIKTTKSLTTYKLIPIQPATIISSFGEDQTTVKVFNTFDHLDSIPVRLLAQDSIINRLDTTLYAKFAEREAKPEKFEMSLQNAKVIGTKGIIHGQIKFSKPLSSIDYDSIYYRIDSTQIVRFSSENFRWDSIYNLMTFNKTFDKNLLPLQSNNVSERRPIQSKKSTPQPTSTYQLYFGKSAFVSIELDSSQRLTEKLIPSTLAETGIIFVEVQPISSNYFVQLLTKDFLVVDTKYNAKKISFEDLKPGDYQIRLIIDKDNDGQWDPGNYYSREEPEKIIFYRNEKLSPLINLKANWELGPLLIKE